MSWIAKAENLLNNIDQKAASLIQQQNIKTIEENDSENLQRVQNSLPQSLSRIPSISKNIMILSKTTPKKSARSDHEYDSYSEKSMSSRHTVVENENEDDLAEMKKMKAENSSESFSVEKEIAMAKIMLSELRSENNELKMEIETLQEQLKTNASAMKNNDLENLLKILTDEKRDFMLINSSLESSNANYIKTISELESNIMKLQQNENELKQKLDYAKNETKDINAELQNYKLRAQNQLQMKEKIIEQLKLGTQLEMNRKNDSNDTAAFQIEIDHIKNERDHLQSELKFVKKRLDDSKNLIEKMEHKHRIMVSDYEDKVTNFNDCIKNLTLQCTNCEDDLRLQKQENSHVREEMLKQKTHLTTKLHEKENELKRLKNAYRESQVNSEIENRVQSLTQSLITKQNNLELITAEKNALRLQYEKLATQHEELRVQMRNQRTQFINVNETDDVKSSISSFLTINPFDSRMSRKVKRAYSNFDQLGIRFGAFLRRYPLARIFSIVYVCSLHLFVLLVLLQSTPSQ